jgi:hypothetical protein
MHFRDVRVGPECVVSRPIGEKKTIIIFHHIPMSMKSLHVYNSIDL